VKSTTDFRLTSIIIGRYCERIAVAQTTLDVLTEFITAFMALVLVGAVALTISTSEGRLGPIGLGFVAVTVVVVGVVAHGLLSDTRTLTAKDSRNRARHWLVFVGGFLAFFVVLTATAALISATGLDGLITAPDSVPMAIVFGGPILVSALSAYFGGRVLDSFAIGAVPSIYLGVYTLIEDVLGLSNPSPDSPWTFIVFVLPVYAVPAALVGFVVGIGAKFAVNRIRHVPR
jgi:hypothetical protein